MKRFITFIIRLSILNFIFYMLAVFFVAKYNEISVKRGIQKEDIPVSPGPTFSSPTKQASGSVSLFSQLQNHNSRSDCWIAYSGHIYDITSFFGSHPGGDGIMLKYCGQDATAAFDTKDKFPPSPHSENAKSLLQQYLVQ